MFDVKRMLQVKAEPVLRTPLLLRSGKMGDYADTEIERTPDNRLHVNGYVWASLIRRTLERVAGGGETAARIGKFDKDHMSVSPLWCESALVELHATDIVPGIRIDRKYGTAAVGALYQQEVAPAGLRLPLRFTFMLGADDDPDTICKLLLSALWVANQGVETIGGGWSYGYGRLSIDKAETRVIDLADSEERSRFQDWDSGQGFDHSDLVEPGIAKPWMSARLGFRICDGQLLAVKTGIPPLELPGDLHAYKLPDSFVYRAKRFTGDGPPKEQPVIPGKAVRQALFSTEIERRLRFADEDICLRETGENCKCSVCLWFGSLENRGLISVADAPVQNAETAILNRIHLCEHSMQNINLFSGEYLTRGDFETVVIVDHAGRYGQQAPRLVEAFEAQNRELSPEAAPPGWHRIGGTSSCTGQVEMTGMNLQTFGDVNG
jgi:hypothetical protein